MPAPRQSRRSAAIAGVCWANRVTSIAFQLAVPPVVGFFADRKLDTSPWLVLLGVALGMTTGTYEIVKLSRLGRGSNESSRPGRDGDEISRPGRDIDKSSRPGRGE